MNLSRKIAAALAKSKPPETLLIEEGSHRLLLEVRAASGLGIEADSLEFGPLEAFERSRTLEELKAWADRIVARVTYLMEPLILLEADSQGVEVELRSECPTPRDGLRSYYEARLDCQGTARIMRLAFDETTRVRTPVPFQLTREVLERLADDLVFTWV